MASVDNRDNKDTLEFELASIDGADANSRLVIVLQSNAGVGHFVLKRQTFGRDVGWYTQSEIEMTREEMVAMRSALGASESKACRATKFKMNVDAAPAILAFPSAEAS